MIWNNFPRLGHIWYFIVSPNITIPVEGQEFTITEGSDGSITCTATGYPPPTVVWQNIDSNDRIMSGTPMISPTGVGNVISVSVELMVTGGTRGDTGMYICSAENSVGKVTDVTVTITVQCECQDTVACHVGLDHVQTP